MLPFFLFLFSFSFFFEARNFMCTWLFLVFGAGETRNLGDGGLWLKLSAQ